MRKPCCFTATFSGVVVVVVVVVSSYRRFFFFFFGYGTLALLATFCNSGWFVVATVAMVAMAVWMALLEKYGDAAGDAAGYMVVVLLLLSSSS